MPVANGEACATVWITDNTDEPLHGGRAVEYIVTIQNGTPKTFQRTLYRDGEVQRTNSGPAKSVPPYVRVEVEKHMIPRGAWPS